MLIAVAEPLRVTTLRLRRPLSDRVLIAVAEPLRATTLRLRRPLSDRVLIAVAQAGGGAVAETAKEAEERKER